MNSDRRVVVTGLGLVSPVGNTVDTAWQHVVQGISGIGPVTHFDNDRFACRIAGEVRNFDVTEYLTAKSARKMDPFVHYGLAAGIQAINDSGLLSKRFDPRRIGVSIGAGIGGLKTIEDTHQTYLDKGPRRISPFFVPSTIINMISGHLSIMYDFQGPNLAIVTACSTATHNIGQAARSIAYGDADVMLAGGAEHATTPIAMGAFISAKALSTRNDEPAQASRPWDAGRDGFVLSDGAGVLLLESLDHAQERGARIYAELAGFGMSGDAYHMTAPKAGGEGASLCMQNALQDAGIHPAQVDYVNAHGTSTLQGDRAEAIALKETFGTHIEALSISSTKSVTGHLLGAAGGLEAVVSLKAIAENVVPPTINLHQPDPECAGLNLVANQAQERRVDVVMSNSFGFGGTNGTLIFRRL